MRENIGLYRGKRKDNGEWINGFYFQKPNPMSEDGLPIYHGISDLPPFGAEVDPETVGQYTGMEAYWIEFENEPQEADVWEGDLLEVEYDGKKVVAVVTFEVGMFILVSFEFNDNYIPLFDVVEVDGDEAYIKAKVIGNIHDNPELLEGEK